MFNFLELVPIFYFWIGDWELGYACPRFWYFLERWTCGESTCIYSVCGDKNLVALGHSWLIIRSSSKWPQKIKRGRRWLCDYLVNFYFIYFLVHVKETSFCFKFFSFNCNFDFFYQWWQIIKRNLVLFPKKSRYWRVRIDEWLIMNGLTLLMRAIALKNKKVSKYFMKVWLKYFLQLPNF